MPRPARTAARVAAGARSPPRTAAACRSATSSTTRSSTRAGATTAPAGCDSATGGHYDTYPLALSPLFGRMVAEYAFRSLAPARATPARFEICELGAGNGQLCLDTSAVDRTNAAATSAAGSASRAALRYRIVERSPALVDAPAPAARPAGGRGALEPRRSVAHAVPRGAPFARARPDRRQRGARLPAPPQDRSAAPTALPASCSSRPTLAGRAARPQRAWRRRWQRPRRRRRVRFREVVRPLERLPRLAAFVATPSPRAVRAARRGPPCSSCPRFATLLAPRRRASTTRGDALWIDYGERATFHRRAPRSRASLRRPPALRAHRLRRSRVATTSRSWSTSRLATTPRATPGGGSPTTARKRSWRGAAACDSTAARSSSSCSHRALAGCSALAGVGPERGWQRRAVTWSRAAARRPRPGAALRRALGARVPSGARARRSSCCDHAALSGGHVATGAITRRSRTTAGGRAAGAVVRADGDHRVAEREAEWLGDPAQNCAVLRVVDEAKLAVLEHACTLRAAPAAARACPRR